MPKIDIMTDHSSIQVDSPIETEIECLMRIHYPYIRRLAISILDDESEADDTAQETFIAACRSLERFRGEASPRTWLTSIAVNICRGRLRKRKIIQTLQSSLQSLHLLRPAPVSPEENAVQSESDRRLWQAVDHLDEKHRLVVILRYVHELSVPEIATVLDSSQGTVHSRLHYARKKLQAELGSLITQEETSDED
jgi:RNA polymerase sigma-70 factor (ECF subfamily)